MADAVPQNKPVISTISTINAHPEGEMDALLLGRTRVSSIKMYLQSLDLRFLLLL